MSPAIRLEPLTPADGPYFYELGSDPQVARYMRFSPLTDPAQGDELAQSYTTGGQPGLAHCGCCERPLRGGGRPQTGGP